MNDKVKSVIVLTVICLVVTALLAVTNGITAPIIQNTREAKEQESLKTVLPDSGSFTPLTLPDNAPSTVSKAFKAEDGSYAVVLATRSAYSSGDMGVTVGIGPDGTVKGVTLTSYNETKDFGRDTYPQRFIGRNVLSYMGVDSFAGVTYSSTALKKAIGDAFTLVNMLEGGGSN